MKIIISIGFILFSNLLMASEKLTCTIYSGVEKESLVVSIPDEAHSGSFFSEEGEYAGVKDLSFSMTLDCYIGNCEVSVVIDSQMRESEVGEVSSEFSIKNGARVVFEEGLENTPDGEDYKLDCQFTRKL